MKSTTAAMLLCVLLVCVPAVSQKASCPASMVIAKEGVCIDRYEWPNKAGVKPLTYASGVEEPDDREVTDAATLCATVGKRVCLKSEWQAACGPDKYPYGDTFDPEACNTEKLFRKVDEAKVAKHDKHELARLDQSAPSGSYAKCRSPSGAYDMVGNGEEWVLCAEGTFGWCLMGRYWGQRGSCKFVVTKHAPRWHFYESSVRCCSDMSSTSRIEHMEGG